MILVTGGAGYIGSHTCVELLNSGYEIAVLDNLCNSEIDALTAVKEITGKDVAFYRGDIRDEALLDKIFRECQIDAVIHFAGLKAVGESVQKPLLYYDNNIAGTVHLCTQMKKHGVTKIVFSSSATVYGYTDSYSLKENDPTSATSPYGRTKLFIEDILKDLCVSDKDFSAVILRYFNPIGAHESGRLGDNPSGIPNNLMPYIGKVAAGELPFLRVFGDDYPTHDGTGVRDYIHVVDLALGHISALRFMMNATGASVFNLGTGQGYSVLDIVRAFESANGIPIPYKIMERRPGDVPVYCADPSKAKEVLGWSAKYDLQKMCLDSWNYAKKYQK